ncbi:hypothetical protein FRC12_014779 [Ceratobasidium sp. 428]|nr:hypothetical protein FRC12_014779 [Ceratobasidium sp. 428]
MSRPGSLDQRGFGPDALAQEYPGLITASLSAFGLDGPWGGRRGFDSLVQAATGFNVVEAEAYHSIYPQDISLPLRPLPCQVLDHAAGHLLAFGINAALGRRIKEGGNWHVDVSLLGTANWLRSLGRIEPCEAFSGRSMLKEIPIRDIAFMRELESLLMDVPSKKDDAPKLRALRHAAIMSVTPVRIGFSPGGLNAHQAEWLPA